MTSTFDLPLPVISISIDSIDIETNDKYEGSFTVKNTGGGTLNGYILSRCPGLVFTPTQWTGNSQTVTYTFNAAKAGLDTGQSMESHVYISSNGGEQILTVTAKLTKMSIATSEGHIITNLQDFYQYANEHPAAARRLFVDSEFYMLLLAIGYEHMEIYESLHKDPNRERAMDNFLILSGLKDKTTLSIVDRQLEFIKKPYETEMAYGNIIVQKSDNGYVEAPITIHGNSQWINFYASKLIHSDFKDTLATAVHFSIDPALIKKSYVRELVTIGAEPCKENTVEIVYRRAAPAVSQLDRASYRYEDKGIIKVANNTGMDIKVEVSCPESYVRFSARSYLVGSYGEIPFKIKLSAFLNAQLFFRKQPYMKTSIEVKVTMQGQIYKKNLPLIIGEW